MSGHQPSSSFSVAPSVKTWTVRGSDKVGAESRDAHCKCIEAGTTVDARALAGVELAVQGEKEKDGKGVKGVKGVELLRS